MTQPTETILDHIDGIKVPGDPFGGPANEFWAMLCLRNGLAYLARQAAQCDAAIKQRVNPENKLKAVGSANATGLDGATQALLTCAFHWYAVSACNYARLVGAIAYRQDDSRPKPPEYIAKVMPAVLAFRDKVGAHFAWSTENKKDNTAERMFSVFPPLTWSNDTFKVGAMQLYVRWECYVSRSEVIAPWSLTEVHAELCKRYWPDQLAGK